MDSKSALPSSAHDSESPPPPSYSESLVLAKTNTSTTYTTYSATTSSSSTSQYYSSQIQAQLQGLTTTIFSLQTQNALLSHAHDEKILSLLTYHIQLYASDFAKSGLQRGTLILVPKQGLEDDNALPVGYDFRDPAEFDRVVRVSDKESSGPRAYGEECDAGELWYWKDESMALRLAKYLRPLPDHKTMPLPPRKEEVNAVQKPQARSFWGRKKSIAKTEERPPIVEVQKEEVKREDKVWMGVTAEEVVFRIENDLGIWETRTGWGVVLKLKVSLAAR